MGLDSIRYFLFQVNYQSRTDLRLLKNEKPLIQVGYLCDQLSTFTKLKNMIVISYSLSLRALDDYVKNYNAKHPQLAQQIRHGIVATAKDIIRVYGRRLTKVKPEFLDFNQLPPLRTNNIYLAKIGHASPRTIQRHIKRLIEAGVILRKKFRGSRADYELWINPKLLWIDPANAANGVENVLNTGFYSITENQSVKQQNTSSCPHREAGNNNTNIIKEVGKSPRDLSFKKSEKFSSGMWAGYTGEKAPYERKKLREKRKGDQEKEGAGKKVWMRTDSQKREVKNIPKLDKVRSASLSLYTTLLWALAKKVLYANVYLTERQCEIGQKLIRQWYEPVATERLGAVHEVYVSRIGLVRKFLDKDLQNRYVQLPYRYFDVNNPSGFRGTKKWWLKQQKRNRAIGESLLVHHQIKKLQNNQSKDGSESTPPLQLYAECEARVRQLGNPELLRKFYTTVSEQFTVH